MPKPTPEHSMGGRGERIAQILAIRGLLGRLDPALLQITTETNQSETSETIRRTGIVTVGAGGGSHLLDMEWIVPRNGDRDDTENPYEECLGFTDKVHGLHAGLRYDHAPTNTVVLDYEMGDAHRTTGVLGGAQVRLECGTSDESGSYRLGADMHITPVTAVWCSPDKVREGRLDHKYTELTAPDRVALGRSADMFNRAVRALLRAG